MRRLIVNHRINKYYNSLPFESRPNSSKIQRYWRVSSKPIKSDTLHAFGLFTNGTGFADEFVLFYDIIIMFERGASDIEIKQMVKWQAASMRLNIWGRSWLTTLLSILLAPILIPWDRHLDKKIELMHKKYGVFGD